MQPFFVRVFAASGSNLMAFDAALAALQQLPQMLIEPDGSFVWSSPVGTERRWQLDGTLVDGGATLFYCELKGTCSQAALEQLLACLTDGRTGLAVEMVQSGLMLIQDEFVHEADFPEKQP
jgi:hypothetical protein